MLLFTIFIIKSFAYNPSLYVPDQYDYVVTLDADSFYFLENISTPPKAKPIREAHFSSETIEEDSYAWPGHSRTVEQSIEEEEGLNMYNFYKNRVNLTQDDMYYHPKAPEQSWSTWEIVDSLQRAKVKVTLDPIHKSYRTTNLYMPPGELITFEIQPESIGLVKVYVEVHRQIVSINERIKYLQCETVLTETKTTWGYPTGGSVTFELINNNAQTAIEINVTGCVIAPHFVYGVTDEREWEETIRYLQAPSAQITNGAISQFTYSSLIRDIDRMDDVQAWWRSAYLRSQEIAPDTMSGNDKYTITHPLNMRYDNFVGCGIACAYAGSHFIDFTPDWFNAANQILNLKNENPWGSIHEMNHHHQSGWSFNDMHTALTEGTNNVLNTYTYTFQNCASGKRTVDQNLQPITLVDHLETIHPYYLVDWGFIEAEWDLIFHCLGYGVFKKYMDMNIKNSPYSWELYNGYGKHVLSLMEATGYDVYEYCNWYCENTDRMPMLNLLQWAGDMNKYNNFMNTYKNHPAYGKLFHPMACFYACGYIRNNERFETVRPYKINAYINTTFDFNKALRQRSGNKTLWGDFVFDKIISNRQNAWTETSKGIFQYAPVDDLSFIDEAHAYYIDRTTGEEVICIVRLELKPYNFVHKVKYYNFTHDVCNRDNSIFDCYKRLDQHTLWKEVTTDYKGIPWIYAKNLTAVSDIEFVPSETGDYIFGAEMSERGLLYLSNESLTGDYDTDDSHRIITKTYYFDRNNGDINGGKSVPIHLEKGEKVYLRLVVNNAHLPSVCTEDNYLCREQTGETVYVKRAEEDRGFNDNDVLPDDWFKVQEPMDFIPSYIDFKYGDRYIGDKIIKNPQLKWTANVSMAIKTVYNLTNTDYDYSQGMECKTCNDTDVNNALLDWDPTTEVRSGWWPPNENGQPFPHKWDVNFNGEETFDTIFLKGAYVQAHFPMESNISIYLNSKESSCIDIENDENLIWQGIYESKNDDVMRLNKKYTGKYMRIVVYDNKLQWRGGNPGRSTFSYITVGTYSCLSNYKVPRGCNWEIRKDGYYINGRAYVGKAGDSYSYVPDEGINQVALVGDRFYGMGTAKVYLDDVLVKTISENDIDILDLKQLKYASRSYRRILYATPLFDNRPTIRIEVESGEFRITGFIVGSTNESIIINNGPMPTQTPTLYPMPTEVVTDAPTQILNSEISESYSIEESSSEEIVDPPIESSSLDDQEETSSNDDQDPPIESSSLNDQEETSSNDDQDPPIESSSLNDQEETNSNDDQNPPIESSSLNDQEETNSNDDQNPPIESSSLNDQEQEETNSNDDQDPPIESSSPDEDQNQGTETSSINDQKPPVTSSLDDQKPPIEPSSPDEVNPTNRPIISGPSVDNSMQASSGKIEFTENGFKDDNEEHITTSINKDIIIIKSDSQNIELVPDTENAPKQDKYVSIQKPNSQVTIVLPPSGDYGKGEFGIHPNSNEPTINIPTTSIPLNIFNNNDNTVTLNPIGEASSNKTVSILKVTSTKGKLMLKLPENIESIEAKEISIYNDGIIESFAGEKQIDTIIGQLNLNDDSKLTMSNINIKNGLSASSNTKLNIEGKVTFNENSLISLTVSSFIEFGNSLINGICDKLILESSPKNNAALLDQEITLMCGSSFNCNDWKQKFNGNDDFPSSKCSKNDQNENCLIAYNDKNGGGKGNKTGKSTIVIVVVVVVVVVIVAVIVGVLIYMKKKRYQLSSSFENEINGSNYIGNYDDI